MTNLGRGRSVITFTDATVIKYGVEAAEPAHMLLHPKTFVAVFDVQVSRNTRYVMPRLSSPGTDPWALVEASKKLCHLWSQPRYFTVNDGWRDALDRHLFAIGAPDDVLRWARDRINSTLRNSHIHGDPTFANLVRSGPHGPFWWLDPLVRDFTPGDPHVDLGKLFQSCWGYERCLNDPHFTPTFDKQLATQLADGLALDYDQGWAWCAVHIARLLRYQEPRVAAAFGRVLCSMCSI